jgi:hypothetical protein
MATIAELFTHVKESGGMMTAVQLSPLYDEKKGRVSKGPAKSHVGWNKRGWVEKNVRTTPGSANIATAWLMDLKKLDMYVVDVDVKGSRTGRDVLKDEVFQKLYDASAYVVETGSLGLHFYFSHGQLEDGDIIGKAIKAGCSEWFKSADDGEIDFITDAILTEHTTYSLNDATYTYKALKGKLSDVKEWREEWEYHKSFFVVNPRKERERGKEAKRLAKEERKSGVASTKEDEKLQEVMEKRRQAEEEEVFQHQSITWEEVVHHLACIQKYGNMKQYNYKKWYEMGQTIKNLVSEEEDCDEEGFQVFNQFSSFCPSYDGEWRTRRFWNKLERRTDGTVRTAGSILFLSKQAHPEAYADIRKTFKPMGYTATKELWETNHFYFTETNSIAEVDSHGHVHLYDLDHAHILFNDWVFYKMNGTRPRDTFTKIWIADGSRRKISKFVAKKMEECEKGEYPLFTHYHYETLSVVPTDEERKEAMDVFIDLVSAVCNDETVVAEYILNSIAHMIQKPFEKTGKIIAFASPEQGTGKDSLMETVAIILGKQGVAHYTSTEQFWDKHDVLFVGKPFVYLEEACSRQNKANEGRLKARATSSDINVNPKGLKPHTVPNFGRHWMTTNETQPFHTDETDRRGLLIKPSTRLMKQDWAVYHKKKVEPWFIKSVGEWLEQRDISKWDAAKDMPTTELKKDIQELSKKSEQVFFEQWTGEGWFSSAELFRVYRLFCSAQEIPGCMSAQSFGIRILHYKGRYFRTAVGGKKTKWYAAVSEPESFEAWSERVKV